MLAALVAGVGGGLIYTWVLDPLEEYESAPDALRSQDKLLAPIQVLRQR